MVSENIIPKQLTLHIVTVDGSIWYHGPTADNALDHVMRAIKSGETKIDHTRQPWPKMSGRIKVQCCAGIAFHDSDCPAVFA